jgi:ribosomal protein L29
MKKSDFAELKGLTEKELMQKRDDIVRKLYGQSVQVRLGQFKDFSVISKMSKDVAQINTVLRQKASQQVAARPKGK